MGAPQADGPVGVPSVADTTGSSDVADSDMPDSDTPDSDGVVEVGAADAADADGVAILVVRSGGIAGMTRRWSVQPAEGETAHWIVLVERCPWDETPPVGTGADRFVWRIEVRIHRERHEQVIPEEHLSGPWHDLVDAVRTADAGSAPERH